MIFLDCAATSFQKPPSVSLAMERTLRSMSSPGRGGYASATLAAETAFQCRTELAELFGVDTPEQVVFTLNATHALNLAIKSLIPPGGRAVISGYEHNAVTRPLAALGADVQVVQSPLFRPDLALEAFEHAAFSGVDAVICTHVSNVFGFTLPIEEIAALCHRRGVPLIVDASQSAGILALNLHRLGAAFCAMPGHKGLYGPQGIGVLLCGTDAPVKPLMEGGTGSLSRAQEMPEFLPDRLESGTQNMPGIAGLLEGVRFVRRESVERICAHERHLAATAVNALRSLPGVQVFAQPDISAQTGVFSFLIPRLDTERVGALLAEKGIAVRAGLHCAPLAHRSAGTLETGTVRVSFSRFNTDSEVLRLWEAVEEICRNLE